MSANSVTSAVHACEEQRRLVLVQTQGNGHRIRIATVQAIQRYTSERAVKRGHQNSRHRILTALI